MSVIFVFRNSNFGILVRENIPSNINVLTFFVHRYIPVTRDAILYVLVYSGRLNGTKITWNECGVIFSAVEES